MIAANNYPFFINLFQTLKNNKMVKILQFCLVLLLMPFFSFSQWSALGGNLIGMEGDRLGSKNAMSLDATGETLAVGSPFNSENGAFSGYAKVFSWDGNNWVEKGETIKGILPDTEGTGAAVSLSADGNTLALGIGWGLNAMGWRCGIVKVYDWDGNEWIERGGVINGEGNEIPNFRTDTFGTALSLSADGNFIVIGGPGNTPEVGVLQLSGHARVYEWDGTEWIQIGEDLDGQTSLERYGETVDINDQGNVVAIGGSDRNVFDADSMLVQAAGYVRVFEWLNGAWEQRGEPFFGTGLGEGLGKSVKLSADGNTLAFGTPNNFSLVNPGVAKVFDWNGTTWIQRGADISGINLAQTGSSLDLSDDGNIIAVGEPWQNSANGQVRVFEWKNNAWEQVDNLINDAGPSSDIIVFGSEVSISSDGSRVAVGAPSVDAGGLFNTGQITVFENQSLVNVSNLETTNLQVYPNPTDDFLSIKADEKIESVSIFNIAGKEINTKIISAETGTFDIQNLPSGTYFLSIQMIEKTERIKVVKH